jgi:CBS domain-containing protein
MQVRDIMSSRPIVVSADERSADLRHLMEAGRVHHLPVVEGGRLLGMWVATEEGPLVMFGPERIHQTRPTADAGEAMQALLDDAEAVVVWDSGVPAGVLTRSDAISVVRAALSRGIGRRHPRPVVMRIAGAAGCGKTTLLVRTLALLGRLDVAVVQANAVAAGDESALVGARVVDDPAAHWRQGLHRAVERLSDAQLILVEDRDAPPEPSRGIGEDVQIVVVPAAELADLDPADLDEVQAVVASRADETPEQDVEDGLIRLREARPGLHTFAVAAGHDDRGLDAWARWVEAQVLHRRG